MLTGANKQIITAYEVEGMTAEQIAESLDFDVVAVKATLLQFSPKYREDVKEDVSLDFTVDEQLEAKNAMIRLMRSSEDDYLVARLACKIRDDGKGRLDVNANMKGLNVNVVLFNERLERAKEVKLKALAPPPPEPKNRLVIQDAELITA